MQLENQFTVDAPISDVWDVLEDIPRVVNCLPGATLTSSDGDEHEGNVAVRLGPMKVVYEGHATVTELDQADHRARLVCQGRDIRGGGKARADVQMVATEVEPGATHVTITTDLDITGRVAQFGRGVLQDVSTSIVDEFAARLSGEIRREEEAEPAATVGLAAETAAPAAGAAPAGVATPSTDTPLDAGAIAAVIVRRPTVAFGIGVLVGLILGHCIRRQG